MLAGFPQYTLFKILQVFNQVRYISYWSAWIKKKLRNVWWLKDQPVSEHWIIVVFTLFVHM